MVKEEAAYCFYTKPAELHKAINTLKGLVAGISADGNLSDLESKELVHWCDLHRVFVKKHPFSEIIPLIDEVIEDNVITDDEIQDVLWVCNNLLSDADYYNAVTSGVQQLQGLLHGILADRIITDRELKNLRHWLDENDFLRSCYPYDEIDSILTSVLSDGKVSDDERSMLEAYFSTFIDLRNSYNLNAHMLEDLRRSFNINGLCSVDPQIIFDNMLFCITGQSGYASRNEMAEEIVKHGGRFNNTVIKETQYLLVGNEGSRCWAFACYGRKVEKALEMRKKGSRIMIVHENDFWDAIR